MPQPPPLLPPPLETPTRTLIAACLDIAVKNNGFVCARVSWDPRAASDPLLKGYMPYVLSFERVDVLREGGAAELAALGRAADDVDAGALSIEDAVMLHVRAMLPRLQALVASPAAPAAPYATAAAASTDAASSDATDATLGSVIKSGKSSSVAGKGARVQIDRLFIESQPMGGSGASGGGPAAAALATRNTRTKCCQHALQGALLTLPATRDLPVQFVSSQIKAQDFDSLGVGKPRDYADRKKFGVQVSKRILAATLRIDRGLVIDAELLDGGDAEAIDPLLAPFADHPNTAMLRALLTQRRQRGVHKAKHDDECDAFLEVFYASRAVLATDAKYAVRDAKAQHKAAKNAAAAAAAAKRAAAKAARTVKAAPALVPAPALAPAPALVPAVGEKRRREQNATPREAAALRALAKRFPLKKAQAAAEKALLAAARASAQAELQQAKQARARPPCKDAAATLEAMLDEL